MATWLFLLEVLSLALAQPEHVVVLPQGAVGLSTRGKALRVRLAPELNVEKDELKEVLPREANVKFGVFSSVHEEGIRVDGLGSISIFKAPGALQLRLRDMFGKLVTQGDLEGCAGLLGRKAEGGKVLVEKSMNAGACCDACHAESQCTDWFVSQGRCVLVQNATGWSPEIGAVAGRSGGLLIFNSSTAQLYGRGAGPKDALKLLAAESPVTLANRATYVPYFYSKDGYAALGHSNVTHFNRMAARYHSTGQQLAWAFEGAFQLFLMPAASLAEGTKAYYALTGPPAVPPRHILGFMACRWGWKDRRYLEDTVDQFRRGGFPLDSVILDFEWFANTSDYSFNSSGEEWYQDFGWNSELFPEPTKQLKKYLEEQQVFLAGIRKPRLGNQRLLKLAQDKGWLAPQGGPETYAVGRWLRFSDPEMRSWYSQQMEHYLTSGISYWWNDEGENFYYTYHDWNLAELDLHQIHKARQNSRFFSLNRAFTPGMARLGAAVWTGDVESSWQDLRKTAGMMLNWALAGAPYVACDIGGFFGNASSQLLTRWYQVGSFMPLMRTHSTHDDQPHWPWLYSDAHIMRQALIQRYRLLPYHYSLAHRLNTEGELFIRPLAMDFPEDPKVEDLTSQWMDGEILVSPVLSKDSHAEIYLPEGLWHPFNVEGEVIQGPHYVTKKVNLADVPAFVRLGTVLVLAPGEALRSSLSLPGGDLEVQVYAGAPGNFTLIEDDGDGDVVGDVLLRRTTFVWDDTLQQLSWTVANHVVAPKGSFQHVFLTVFASKGSNNQRMKSKVVPLSSSGTLSVYDMRGSKSLRQVKSGHFYRGSHL